MYAAQGLEPWDQQVCASPLCCCSVAVDVARPPFAPPHAAQYPADPFHGTVFEVVPILMRFTCTQCPQDDLLCSASTWNEVGSEGMCALWLSQEESLRYGYGNCQATWQELCPLTDHPEGAAFNSATLAESLCASPCALCANETYQGMTSPDEACQVWLDAGHNCTSSFDDACVWDAHVRRALA